MENDTQNNLSLIKKEREYFKNAKIFVSSYVRDYAYKHGNEIYQFMKKYDIGESNYGQLMDAIGRNEAVHRLVGHHLVFDFPLKNPENWGHFLTHEFSDLFTKQGLPILPEKILKDTGLINYCKSLSNNWNFVNGFDLLAGTLAIYQGGKLLKATFKQEISINSFKDFAKTLGVGVLELAIAFSTANPFLLIGAALQIVGSIKGILNDSSLMYFSQVHSGLKIEFTLNSVKVDKLLKQISVKQILQDVKIQTLLDQVKFKKPY